MSGPIVETMAGRVEGVERDGVAQFRGIPFAAPPTGTRRFLPPEPVTPWTGVRKADASRTSPPQLSMGSLLNSAEELPIDEDCLELNVFTPAADGGKRPVMVWFYGGGFTMGSAATYDGASLAARGDVVVVTVNYRIGALGFSFLEHLDTRFAGSGNAGIRDQIASLEWVRDNIAAFGGDPRCVTIFGESAGGHAVGCLLISPEAKGLFHRAIMESSAGWGLRTTEWAEDTTSKLMAELGTTTVEELQAVEVDAILAAQAGLPMRAPDAAGGPRTMGTASFPFAPTVDGVVIHGAVTDEVAAGRAELVPILLCHTRDEVKLFAAMGVVPAVEGGDDDLAARMSITLPDPQAAVEAYRTAEPGGSPNDWYISFLTDQTYHMPDFRLADLRLQHDARVWMARFSWSSAENDMFGACHGMEIAFLFWKPGQTGGFLGENEAPAEVAFPMQDAWVAFARTGDPNCESLPPWPRYDARDRAVMSIDTESQVVNDPDGIVRTLWQNIIL